jgi:hypothetical protein
MPKARDAVSAVIIASTGPASTDAASTDPASTDPASAGVDAPFVKWLSEVTSVE